MKTNLRHEEHVIRAVTNQRLIFDSLDRSGVL